MKINSLPVILCAGQRTNTNIVYIIVRVLGMNSQTDIFFHLFLYFFSISYLLFLFIHILLVSIIFDLYAIHPHFYNAPTNWNFPDLQDLFLCLHTIYVQVSFFQLSYECAVEARIGFLSYYSSLLDTLVTDAPCVGLGDGKYKVCDL